MEYSTEILRTSTTHPLIINTLPVAAGALGLTFCPGKKQALSMTGGWDRDLETDLQVIKSWNADIVISLMEHFEYAEIGVPDLPTLFEERFQLRLDLPIVDKQAPVAAWVQRWRLLRLIVANGILNGQRVLIHCKGGLGRTGTIAAMILNDLGTPMPDAIKQVRATRAGAVETIAQELFLADYQLPTIKPRALRCVTSLLNGALGDAIGGPLEFLDRATIQTPFPNGLRSLLSDANVLQITDDTQMTLYTLAGMLDAPSNADIGESIRRAYVTWYNGQTGGTNPDCADGSWTARLFYDPTVNSIRAPGQTCLSALAAGGHGTIAAPINKSKGCGGVMRVAPIAWLTADALEAQYLAVKAAAMTHGHPLGYQPAGLLVFVLWRHLCANMNLADITTRLLEQWPGYDELLHDLLGWALEFGNRPDAPGLHTQLLGEGWVGEEALAIGLCHALRAEATSLPLSQILWDAAAHDGDSDSTSAIAGNLCLAPIYDTVAVRALLQIDALNALLDFSEALLAHEMFELCAKTATP